MARQLRALTALTEDRVSTHRMLMMANCSSREPSTLLWPPWALYNVLHTQACRQNTNTYKKFSKEM